MPYIMNQRRTDLLAGATPLTAGELNYMFTVLISQYLQDRGKSYQTMNDILGALEGAKLEFVRRVVNPYEERKMAENGDVYD